MGEGQSRRRYEKWEGAGQRGRDQGQRRRENGEEHEVPKKLNQLRYFRYEISKLLLTGLEGLMPMT